jgi:SAM-dependent methyltransferase
MRNKEKWKPSKFVYRNNRLAASRDPRDVGIGSRLNADIIASYHDRYLKQYCRGNLVDLGCGKVPLYGAYREYVTDSVCVDWAGSLHKSEHVDVECDLNGRLPFADAQFDTIILSDVLEHISQPDHLWTEMSRILAAGGKLVVNVPFYYWLHEAPHDYYRYTEYCLRRSAQAHGFSVLVLEPMGGVPEILADILAKNVRRIPGTGKHLAIAIQYLTGLFLKTGVGRKISKATRRTFPLGYFLVAEKCG